MEWAPVVENLGFPITMVLIMVTWITGVGGFVCVILWKHFFVPVKNSMISTLNNTSETNDAILKRVEDQGARSKETHEKIVAVAERQSGFHDFLQKAGGYQMLLAGASQAKSNGETLDRIETKVDVVIDKLS